MRRPAAARCLGFESHLGRLAPGAKSRSGFLTYRRSSGYQMNDPLNQLAYTEDGLSVRHVMVGGRFIVRDRQLRTIDLQALARRASAAQARLKG